MFRLRTMDLNPPRLKVNVFPFQRCDLLGIRSPAKRAKRVEARRCFPAKRLARPA